VTKVPRCRYFVKGPLVQRRRRLHASTGGDELGVAGNVDLPLREVSDDAPECGGLRPTTHEEQPSTGVHACGDEGIERLEQTAYDTLECRARELRRLGVRPQTQEYPRGLRPIGRPLSVQVRDEDDAARAGGGTEGGRLERCLLYTSRCV